MFLFLAIASAVAWLGASKSIFNIGKKALWFKSGDDVQSMTAWERVLLTVETPADVVVGGQLKSGIWVQGTHDAHSDVGDEDGNRQLILRSPLKCRLKDDNTVKALEPFDRLVIQASEIDYLTTCVRRTNEDI